jgi:hypothetical protein
VVWDDECDDSVECDDLICDLDLYNRLELYELCQILMTESLTQILLQDLKMMNSHKWLHDSKLQMVKICQICDEKIALNECKYHQISHDDENSREKCQISHEDDEILISIERCLILGEKCQISHDEMVVEIGNDLVWEAIHSRRVSWQTKNSKRCMMRFMLR